MCLAMCLKKQEFQADCVYKLGVYKKKVCTANIDMVKNGSYTSQCNNKINKNMQYSN